MSINPPTDLIVDVMRQADPTRAREAAERLATIGRTAKPAATANDFAAYVKSAISGKSDAERPAGSSHAMQLPPSLPQGGPAGVRADPKLSPGQQLEAFVLTSLIETMMPKDAESVFGSGTAGSYWRSMLAEKLAAELTMAGGVGLGEQLKLSGTDRPEAASMLRAVLEAGKKPVEMTAKTSDALGLSAFSGMAAGEMVPADWDGTIIMQPESNGA